jgi:Flp pilus assembly protein TadD
MMAHRGRVIRLLKQEGKLLASISLLAISLSLAGCIRGSDPTAAVDGSARSQDALHAQAESLQKRYSANPGDKTISLNYAHVLTALDEKNQAAAVLQAALVKSPKDRDLLAAFGKALVDTGDYNQALEVLSRAHSPDRPDWHVLSAEGIASDSVGQHDRAQGLYLAALKIEPDDPTLMSNLGLSYALARKLPDAERVLTQAADSPRATPKVRQNLALVLALEGRFDNALQMLRHDLSPTDAAKNIADIKSMIAQPNTWDEIRGKAKPSSGQTVVSRAASSPTQTVSTAPTDASE